MRAIICRLSELEVVAQPINMGRVIYYVSLFFLLYYKTWCLWGRALPTSCLRCVFVCFASGSSQRSIKKQNKTIKQLVRPLGARPGSLPESAQHSRILQRTWTSHRFIGGWASYNHVMYLTFTCLGCPSYGPVCVGRSGCEYVGTGRGRRGQGLVAVPIVVVNECSCLAKSGLLVRAGVKCARYVKAQFMGMY